MGLVQGLLSDVTPEMADTLAYFMIVVVGAMLVTGAIVAYVYYRKNKRYRAASLQEQNPSPAQ